MTDGAFTFLSWSRRGLATAVGTSTTATVTEAVVDLSFDTDVEILPAQATLSLIGPGDIVGLDSKVIVRTWPPPDDLDAEFVAYPLIEFDQAELPWRYSPEPSPDGTTQLRPWFSLLVLKASECSLSPSTPEQKLGVLTVNNASFLPPSADLWAWAHTQVEGQSIDPNTDPQGFLQRITGEPGLFSARLLSPRLLLPNIEYVACLVPTFERGRLAGLGELDPDATTPPVRDLWAAGATKFPVYFSWRFRTGTLGNFEHAARLIKPSVLPATVGRRDMDVEEPGFELPEAAAGSRPVEGALLSVAAFEAGETTWPDDEGDEFILVLKALVNAPADPVSQDPKVVPPLYGQWYAADQQLRTISSNPRWYYELNSDPRNRVAAALGTKVIQREQQALLAGGWDQVAEIRQVNDRFRVLQLARGLTSRIYERHFASASLQRFFHITLRLHAWVTCGSMTVCGQIKSSPITPAFMSAQWLRWTRPRGPIGRFQGRLALPLGFASDLLAQLNACKHPVPEPPTPPGLHDPKIPRGRIPCADITDFGSLGINVTLFWALVILWVVRKLMVSQNGDCWWIAIKALRYAIVLIQILIDPDDVRRRCKWFDRAITFQDFVDAPPMPNFAPFATLPNPIPLPQIPGPPGVDSGDAPEVRAALIRLFQAIARTPASLCRPSMDLDVCDPTLRLAIRPEVTIGERVKNRLFIRFPWTPKDPLEPHFAPPEYERPMYLPLSEISFDWILPGLNDMKRDSASLAVTNQRFIEAYMTGLNHEMTRELLWNEFPTDQRGTYFRQFWDIAACILEDGSTLPPEQLRDIEPLRLWDKTKGLGGHSPRPAPVGSPQLLVLVVRAQLIQKYPNVIVYAQKRNPATNRLTGTQNHPVFYALLQPDIAFYGFQMTLEELRADDNWYFVLQEQPGDPKFADEESVPVSARSDALRYTSPATFGADAGFIAQETFLQPFRVGIQAKAMLPEEEP